MGIRSIVRKDVVVDASAAVAIIRREPHGPWMRRLLHERMRAGDRALVPNTLWHEVVNVLARRYRYGADEILESVARLDALGLTTVAIGRPGLLLVLEATVVHGLSSYDAVYLMLAESNDADLLTLDRVLATAAGDRAVPPPVDGVREAAQPYRLQPWIAWEEAGQYLDAVRQATLEEARR